MITRLRPASLCVLSALALGFSANTLAETTLSALFMTQAAYSENDIRAMTADFTKAHPDIKVNLEFVPYEALHDKIVAARGAGAKGYDVVLFDAIWPAEFTKYGLLQDVTSRINKDQAGKIFAGAISTVTYQDKRWGMPWILDTKYLYYNKAMLAKAGITAPPTTWQELAQQAEILKEKNVVKYPLVWSWSQSEALICDYTTLVSAFKGDFYQDGKLNFTNPGAMKAINYMKDSLDKGLTNPNSREYLEEDVRKSFSNGDAAFALNWTYMYNMANDPKQSKVAGDVGVVPAPGEAAGQASGVNGSMGLGIARASVHPDQAWEYISYMTSQPVQDKYAKLSLPIWKSSYDDPAVQKGQEALIAAAKSSLNVMLSRPVTPSYSQLSTLLQQNVQSVLQGKAPAADAMAAATQSADRLR